MSDDFYNELLVDVNDTILQFGKEYQVRAKGAFNNETLSVTQGATRKVMGLVSDSSIMNNIGSMGSAGVGTDAKEWVGKKVLLLVATLKPLKTDEINVDGRWYSLNQIQQVKPANVTLLYILDITS
jgi:hypothetical protein